ncbi:MAG: biopolymer transporter ExbD [Pseudomonadota bacterium]
MPTATISYRGGAYRQRFVPARELQPMSALNITPLIDVMLVLLVMMILTIPAMTHKVPLELPQPGDGPTLHPVIHQLDLAANGALRLDGAALAPAALPGRLAALKADPNAELHVNTDPMTRYDRFDETLATIKRAHITRLGFVGNERYTDF